MSCQKLNTFRDFSIKDRETLSKAFLKSTIGRRPGMWCLLAIRSVSYNNLIFSPKYLPFKNPSDPHASAEEGQFSVFLQYIMKQFHVMY